MHKLPHKLVVVAPRVPRPPERAGRGADHQAKHPLADADPLVVGLPPQMVVDVAGGRRGEGGAAVRGGKQARVRRTRVVGGDGGDGRVAQPEGAPADDGEDAGQAGVVDVPGQGPVERRVDQDVAAQHADGEDVGRGVDDEPVEVAGAALAQREGVAHDGHGRRHVGQAVRPGLGGPPARPRWGERGEHAGEVRDEGDGHERDEGHGEARAEGRGGLAERGGVDADHEGASRSRQKGGG